jgi:hypothetical protein
LAICISKINNIYKKNKFLKKWYIKLNENSSNIHVNRIIYAKKTKMLMNISEKLNDLIISNKNNLKRFQDTNEIKTMAYCQEIIKRKKIDKENERIYFNKYTIEQHFNCKVSKILKCFIISSFELVGFPNISSVKSKKGINKKKRKSSKDITKKSKNTNNEGKFAISKSQNRIDEKWMQNYFNVLSIQEKILRSNQDYYNRNNSNRYKKDNKRKNTYFKYKRRKFCII